MHYVCIISMVQLAQHCNASMVQLTHHCNASMVQLTHHCNASMVQLIHHCNALLCVYNKHGATNPSQCIMILNMYRPKLVLCWWQHFLFMTLFESDMLYLTFSYRMDKKKLTENVKLSLHMEDV